MKVTVEFGPAGQQSIDRLEGLSGAAFDQAYMSENIREHEQDLAAFERMATSARSAEVRKLSSTGASTVREHLTLAQQVGSQVGVSSTAGRVGGVPTPAPTTTTDDRTNAKNGEDHNNANNNEHASLGAADRAFVDNVLRDHLMHIRLAKQAQHQGSDEVKDLAERIEKDFTKWSERWESFADKRDAEVSSKLQPHNKEKLDRLNKAKDREEFDRAYADLVGRSPGVDGAGLPGRGRADPDPGRPAAGEGRAAGDPRPAFAGPAARSGGELRQEVTRLLRPLSP